MDENNLNELIPEAAQQAVSEGVEAVEAAAPEVAEAVAEAAEAVAEAVPEAAEAVAEAIPEVPAFEAPAYEAPAAPAYQAPAAPAYQAPAAPEAPVAPAAPAYEAPAAPAYDPAYAAPAAPAYDPAYAAPAAPAYDPAYAAPAAPAYDPAYAAPAAPAYDPAYAAPAAPVYDPAYAAPAYTPAPEFNKPKKKKTGLIVGICAAVALIAAALLIWFFVLSPSSITLSTDYTTFEIGDSVVLTATVNPGSAINKDVTWSSSDTSVATVDADGKVTGVYPGTCTITAKTSNGKTATCRVEVTMSYYEAIILGEWDCIEMMSFDDYSSYNPHDYGDRITLTVNPDYTLELNVDGETLDATWFYTGITDLGNYGYDVKNNSNVSFIYAVDEGEIWFFLGSSCLTFVK